MNPTPKNQPKKIFFVITKSNWGGAQRYVFDLANAFHIQGHKVKVIFGGEGILAQKLKETGIETLSLASLGRDVSLIGDIKTAFTLLSVFLREGPDVVHLNSSKAGLGAVAARCARVNKIIFTLHGLALNEERPWYQKSVIGFFYLLTILFSHQTIAVSKALKSQTEKIFPFLKKKISLIHNGLIIPNFKNRSEAREILIQNARSSFHPDIPLASLVFGTIGELHPIKGHSYLLEGFKQALNESIVPLFLFIVGSGQETEKRKAQIASLKLDRNVFLCGHIDEASTLLKAFDAFIFPSISEGLPYAVAEAGLAELPSICTNVGGIPEIIVHNKTGLLIHPRSSQDIAHAILTLTYNHDLRKNLGRNIHHFVQDEFSLDRMIASTEKIYNI